MTRERIAKPVAPLQRAPEVAPQSRVPAQPVKPVRLPRTLDLIPVSPAQLEVQRAQALKVQRLADLEVQRAAIQRAHDDRFTTARASQILWHARGTKTLGVQRAVADHARTARDAHQARVAFVAQRQPALLETLVAQRLEAEVCPALPTVQRQADLTLPHVAAHLGSQAAVQLARDPERLSSYAGFKNTGAGLVKNFRTPGSRHTMPELASAIQRFRDPMQRAAVEGAAFAAFGSHPTYPKQLQRALEERDSQLEVQRQVWQRELEPVAQRQALEEATGEGAAQQIEAARGGGQPLPAGVRAMLETKWNTDLSKVRVHTDSRSSQISKKLNAKALTTGQDIFFGASTFNPTSLEGLQLIAHEAWHTVQQAGGLVQAGIDRSQSLELEARGKGAELSSGDVQRATKPPELKAKGVNNHSQKPGAAPAMPSKQTAKSLQRAPTSAAAKPAAAIEPKTPEQFVQAFREAVSAEAIARLKQNRAKLNSDLKGLKNTDPSNPEWKRLRAISAQDGQLLKRWNATAQQIRKWMIQHGCVDMVLLDLITEAKLVRLASRRPTILSEMRLAIQKIRTPPTTLQTAYTLGVEQAAIEKQLKPLEGLLHKAAMIEDIQNAIRLAYPALSVLDDVGDGGRTASAKNTKADNERLRGRVTTGFADIQDNISTLEGQYSQKDQSGKAKNVPMLQLSAVVQGVLAKQQISEAKRKSKDPRSSAVLDFLDKERFWDTAITLGGAVVAGGAAIASMFTPAGWITLTTLGVGAAVGVGVGAYDLQGALTEDRAAQAQRGGTKLTNTSPEEARFNKIMAFVNLGLGVIDGLQVLSAAGKAVKTGRLFEAATRSGSDLLAKIHPARITEYLEATRLRSLGKVKEAQAKMRLLEAKLGSGFDDFVREMSVIVNPDGTISAGRIGGGGGSGAGQSGSVIRVAGATEDLQKLIPDDALLRELLQKAGSAPKLEVLLKTAGNNIKQVERLLKAKNWQAVEPFLHGQAGNLPAGYHYREIKNAAGEVTQVQIVRRVGDDLEMAPLQIGADGTLKVTTQISQRLSNPLAMQKSFAGAYGAVKKGYWIHHLIPDEIVRSNSLMKLAREKLGYSLDRSSNLLGMADKTEWTAISKAQGQKVGNGYTQTVAHWSSHAEYSKRVNAALIEYETQLARKYGNLGKVPANRAAEFEKDLKSILERIENQFRQQIDKGKVPQKDGRLAWNQTEQPRTA